MCSSSCAVLLLAACGSGSATAPPAAAPTTAVGCAGATGAGPTPDGGRFTGVPRGGAGGEDAPVVAADGTAWRLTSDDRSRPEPYRWSGTAWRRVPTTGLGGLLSADAGAVAPGGWAVAELTDKPPNGDSSLGPSDVLAVWDGTRWRRSTPPHPAKLTPDVEAVTMRTAADGWAAGRSYPWEPQGGDSSPPDNQQPGEPFLLHWDGRSWQPAPLPAGRYDFTEVTATGPNDVWLGGSQLTTAPDGTYSGGATVVLHWDGTRWSRYGMPLDSTVTALTATSDRDVWAMVYPTRQGEKLEHWDGTRWTRIDLPGARTLTAAYAGCTGLWVLSGPTSQLGHRDANGRWTWRTTPDDPSSRAATCQGAGLTGAPSTGLWLTLDCSTGEETSDHPMWTFR